MSGRNGAGNSRSARLRLYWLPPGINQWQGGRGDGSLCQGMRVGACRAGWSPMQGLQHRGQSQTIIWAPSTGCCAGRMAKPAPKLASECSWMSLGAAARESANSANQSGSGVQSLSVWVGIRGTSRPSSLGKASVPGSRRDASLRGAAGEEHPVGTPAGQGQGLGTGRASAHLLPVGRGGPQLPPGPPLTRPYEQCLQTLQPPPRPGSPTPRPSSSTRPTSPMPLPWGKHRGAGRGLAGVGCHGGPRTGGLVGTLRRRFSGGVMRQRRPKWGPRLVSLLRGPSRGGQGAAGAQRQPPGGETNSPAPLAPSPPRSALSALVPTAVLLSLLAVAGSAGLIYVLWRRREGKGTQGCHCARPRHSGTHPGELSGAGAGEPGGG
nr:translation initiation factor IF-2-like [Anser cygnoides]